MRDRSQIHLIALCFLIFLLSSLKVFYDLPNRAVFEYDQEYLALSAKDILVNHHFTLVGAPTSVGSIFIGPLYNYLVAVVLVANAMSPFIITYLSAAWYPVTVVATFLVVNYFFDKRTAIFSSIMIFGSFAFGYPTLYPPLIYGLPLLSLLILFGLCTMNQHPYRLLLVSLALGLSFHLHFSSVILLFLTIVFMVLTRPSISHWLWIGSALIILTFLSPLIAFDIRHQGLILKNFIQFAMQQNMRAAGIPQYVSTLFSESGYLLTFNFFAPYSRFLSLISIVLFLKILPQLKKPKQRHAFLVFLWLVAFVGSYSLYNGSIVPYYLSPVHLMFFIIIGIVVNHFWSKSRLLLSLILCLYVVINFFQLIFLRSPLGLRHKIAALERIRVHSSEQPIYLSHTILKGFEGGLEYLEWYLNLNVTDDKTQPIYTLVIPADWIKAKIDYQSGAVGVVYPH